MMMWDMHNRTTKKQAKENQKANTPVSLIIELRNQVQANDMVSFTNCMCTD